MRLSRPHTLLTAAALCGALACLLAFAPSALADEHTELLGFGGHLPLRVDINSMWVFLAGVFVMFMQGGFAMLEVGLGRAKNAGAVVAKILTNFSVCAVGFWVAGFALAFSAGGSLIGTHGFLLAGSDPSRFFPLAFPTNHHGITVETLWFFEFGFCAVALAIVWGTTLERIKFGVYAIYGAVFSLFIYPVVAHWIFGDGWLHTQFHMQDFAGSCVVDVTGAAGAFAVLLLLGPRTGKYGPDGRSRPIPGHNMPLVGLGVLILWMGWFGFNPGSTLNALDSRAASIALVTLLAGAAGVIGALATMWVRTRTFDIGMSGNGAIAGLVAITGPAGYVRPWAGLIIGLVGGIVVVLGVFFIDRHLDDPVGSLPAHGLAGVWGALSCGLFSVPMLATHNLPGSHGGLLYTGSLDQLGSQALGIVVTAAFVFATSFVVFWLIKHTHGLRVTRDEEEAGLDISEHGMYGYPEQFIPASELVGYGPSLGRPRAVHTTKETSE